jgi:chromosome segregation ATPase
MSSTAESAMARLWRDRVQRREQERNEAQTRACAAEERLAALTAETEQLARENALVRAQNDRLAVTLARLTAEKERLAADLAGLREQRAAAPARAEPTQDLGAIRAELLSLLDDASGSRVH